MDRRKCSIGSIKSRSESWQEAETSVLGVAGTHREGLKEIRGSLAGHDIQNNQVP